LALIIRKLICCVLASFILMIAAGGCTNGVRQRSEFVLGTVCTIKFFEDVKPEMFNSIFRYLRDLENIFSANREGTEIDTVNKNAGVRPVKVSPELVEVLNRAIYFAELSAAYDDDGKAVFDPSIGPLVKLWGIGTEHEHVPEEQEIKDALALVDYRDIQINNDEVYLSKKGMSLDLGGIAKGYAADKVAELIKEANIESAIIDLGGNIFALGSKPASGVFNRLAHKTEDYKIGVQDPMGERSTYSTYIFVHDKTIVTSGNYERFFMKDGLRYHHILSTKTGYPVWNNLASVTIIADRSIDADALSTTVFALGYEDGKALLDHYGKAEAIFIFNDSGEVVRHPAP